MNKTIKGSLAAGAAAVLLLGGAGSLAYWTDDATINGGTVNSGFLTLNAVQFDAVNNQDCTDIVYAAGSRGAGTAVVNFVPGDVVSTTCTFEVGAEGDNLAAKPVIPDTVTITPSAGAASFDADVTSTYTLAGAAYTGATPITELNDGNELVATITVAFPFGTDQTGTPIVNGNDTQNVDAILSDLTVSLSQVNPN